jgi:hypothetical protein
MDLETKKNLILEHETSMARKLAERVIQKPALSVWMILVPVIFVYYFWRFQKFAQGRRQFVEQWMSQRSACIEEAFRIAGGENPTPVDQMVPSESLPPAAVDPYARWVKCLTRHFTELMRTEGNSLKKMVRTAYRRRENYLMYLHQLNESEKALNQALLPDLDKKNHGVQETITLIEKSCRRLRRKDAENLFC